MIYNAPIYKRCPHCGKFIHPDQYDAHINAHMIEDAKRKG